MLYEGKPLKGINPPAKKYNTQTMGFHGPEVGSYGLVSIYKKHYICWHQNMIFEWYLCLSQLTKPPGSNYKIRIHDMERMRLVRYKMKTDDNFQSTSRYAQQIQMIDVADKKCVYNRIKRMVDNEMKANEHLFVEVRPKYVQLFLIFITSKVRLNLIIGSYIQE